MSNPFILWFEELSNDDVPLVGGKNASLGEMYGELKTAGVRVPNGFAVTADAWRELMKHNGLAQALAERMQGLETADAQQLSKAAAECRDLIYNAPLPHALRAGILDGFKRLQHEYGDDVTVAVRSSATAEDLPEASFAGQHDTFLNVAGGEALLEAVRHCLASLYTDRAVRYRLDHGFAHEDVALSVGIMKMVRSDLAASGVMFTIDTESGHPDVVFVTAAFGLGENVVQGTVDTDEFYVHKPTYRQGYRRLLRRAIGDKSQKMVYGGRRGGATIHNIPTTPEERACFAIGDPEVLELAGFAIAVEDHYSERAGKRMPMDIEWALDGLDDQLYIVQARPETVASQKRSDVLKHYHLRGSGEVRVSGRAVGGKIAAGPVRVVRSTEDLKRFQAGEVLVAEMTTPDWGTVMRRAAALITNRGGRTCHAAIVARELDIPAVVGTDAATSTLRDGEVVTVSCAEGERGRVYADEVPYEVAETDLSALKRPATRMMVNLGNPEIAFGTGMLPADGVGLARLEFIISEYVGFHPMALVHPEKVEDRATRRRIEALTREYSRPSDFFIERLAEGVGAIAAAFYPRPVVVRLSDFKTNEYATLRGGAGFEPHEENPMLGFRGASRYSHPAYADGFALECAALARVRDDMGLTNVKVMVPFCRRVEEARQVISTMASFGLERGRNGLEVYVMCEIPNNVLLIDDFAQHFDGFSIGSNDLTQLTLGVDRDSDILSYEFDERDPGVKRMLQMAVEGAQRNGRHSGICGQAPSDYPEITEFLVGLGIESLSLNPDTLLDTMVRVAELEAKTNR